MKGRPGASACLPRLLEHHPETRLTPHLDGQEASVQLLCERARASNDGWMDERQSHGLVTNWESLELLNQHIKQAVAVFLEDSRTRLEALHSTHVATTTPSNTRSSRDQRSLDSALPTHRQRTSAIRTTHGIFLVGKAR